MKCPALMQFVLAQLGAHNCLKAVAYQAGVSKGEQKCVGSDMYPHCERTCVRTSPDIAPVCGVMAERFCPRFVLATEAVDTPTSEGACANLGQNIQPEAAKRTLMQTATLDTGRILHHHQQVTCEKERTGAISGLGHAPRPGGRKRTAWVRCDRSRRAHHPATRCNPIVNRVPVASAQRWSVEIDSDTRPRGSGLCRQVSSASAV